MTSALDLLPIEIAIHSRNLIGTSGQMGGQFFTSIVNRETRRI